MKKIFNFQFSIFNTKKGFTLIELLIVIAIIGVLSAILMANFIGVRQRARDGQRKGDLRQIQAALELYRADNGTYPQAAPNCPVSGPTYLGDITCSTTSPVTYMQKVPKDPLSTVTAPIPYSYTQTGTGYTYTLIACLENSQDSQRDDAQSGGTNNSTVCSTSKSYTLKNP